MIHIGKKIRSLAEQKNFTKMELAKGVDTTESNIYKIFSNPNIDLEKLYKFSNIFQVPITYFFTEGTDFPTVEVGAGKVQVDVGAGVGVGVDKALAYPPEEVLKLKKALVRERKRNDRLLTIIEKQADTLKH